jgi:hypothetical protein
VKYVFFILFIKKKNCGAKDQTAGVLRARQATLPELRF